MKKRITLLLLSALLLTNAVSCGASNVTPSPENTSEESSDTSEITSDIYEEPTVESEFETEAPVPKGLSTDEVVETLGLSELYAAVLKGRLQTFNESRNQCMYLDEFGLLTSSYGEIISDTAFVSVLDLDHDKQIDAVVVDGGRACVVLREYDGIVYSIGASPRGMYKFKTDGTFYWTRSAGREYGCSKLSFEGKNFMITEIDRVENDGTSEAKFFVNDQSVTREEYLAYTAQHINVEELTWLQWQRSKSDITLPPVQGK